MICAADLAAAIREVLEEVIQPHRREIEWDHKWSEIEEFANDTDKD